MEDIGKGQGGGTETPKQSQQVFETLSLSKSEDRVSIEVFLLNIGLSPLLALSTTSL